jgi:argininosuccinate lyase
VFLHLGRVVQDLAFWSSFEVGQLYVPNALVQISSIMPQKRNPVPIEHMRHLASVTCGRCDTIINTMHNTPFTDMNDSEGEVQQAGYAAFDSGARVLDLLTAFLPACSINDTNVRRNTDAASITITELADTLVRDENLTFRQAHEIAAHVARTLDGAPLSDGFDTFLAAFSAATERAPMMNEPAFQTATSPETFVERRDRIGGPAPAALDAALTSYGADLTAVRAQTTTRTQRILDADKIRATAFAQLLET